MLPSFTVPKPPFKPTKELRVAKTTSVLLTPPLAVQSALPPALRGGVLQLLATSSGSSKLIVCSICQIAFMPPRTRRSPRKPRREFDVWTPKWVPLSTPAVVLLPVVAAIVETQPVHTPVAPEV